MGSNRGRCSNSPGLFGLLLLTFCLQPAIGASEQDAPPGASQQADPILEAMSAELDRNFSGLSKADGPPLYYLQYELTEERSDSISASRGALLSSSSEVVRYVDVDLRVGSPELDNTHEIRGSGGFDFDFRFPEFVTGPIEPDADAIRAVLWEETDSAFRGAQERFLKVQANEAVKVEKEERAPDFAPAEPARHIGETVELTLDREAWQPRVERLSQVFEDYPELLESSVELRVETTTRHFVNNEGTAFRTARPWISVAWFGAAMADDGMELYLYDSADARSWDRLPSEEQLVASIRELAEKITGLRSAPIVEPYLGPAILKSRAAGVFFHEIFGHRMEGQRQKKEEEGQTFAKKVGDQVLDEILTVYDDPTLQRHAEQDLAGHYLFDNEGVGARRVTLIENGVLETFLMSRSPAPGFDASNGHGRRQPGFTPVGRQGNLVVEASKTVSYDELRKMLIADITAQGKPYGLVFEEVAGGFTSTMRWGTQSFKVLPLLVWRVYPDGRPDEMVRGVDIVGTPLASFSKVYAAADDPAVFNGTCGAESGGVPVSATSPSLLLREVEVEKKIKGQDKPPLLPAPTDEGGES